MKECERAPRTGRALWCELHYRRAQRGADLHAPAKRGPGEQPPPCCLPFCERPARALGLCWLHYHRQRNGTRLNAPYRVIKPGRICSVDGCGYPYVARGFCGTHYKRWHTGRVLDAPLRRKAEA